MLRTVMQIPFHPAAFRIGCFDDAGTGCLHLCQLRQHLTVQGVVLDSDADDGDSTRHRGRIEAGVVNDRSDHRAFRV